MKKLMRSVVSGVIGAAKAVVAFVKKVASDTVEGVRQGLAEEEETAEADVLAR